MVRISGGIATHRRRDALVRIGRRIAGRWWHASRVGRIAEAVGDQVVHLGQAGRQCGSHLHRQHDVCGAVGRHIGHSQRAGLAARIACRAIGHRRAGHRLERGVGGDRLVERVVGCRRRRGVGQGDRVAQRLARLGGRATGGEDFLDRDVGLLRIGEVAFDQATGLNGSAGNFIRGSDKRSHDGTIADAGRALQRPAGRQARFGNRHGLANSCSGERLDAIEGAVAIHFHWRISRLRGHGAIGLRGAGEGEIERAARCTRGGLAQQDRRRTHRCQVGTCATVQVAGSGCIAGQQVERERAAAIDVEHAIHLATALVRIHGAVGIKEDRAIAATRCIGRKSDSGEFGHRTGVRLDAPHKPIRRIHRIQIAIGRMEGHVGDPAHRTRQWHHVHHCIGGDIDVVQAVAKQRHVQARGRNIRDVRVLHDTGHRRPARRRSREWEIRLAVGAHARDAPRRGAPRRRAVGPDVDISILLAETCGIAGIDPPDSTDQGLRTGDQVEVVKAGRIRITGHERIRGATGERRRWRLHRRDHAVVWVGVGIAANRRRDALVGIGGGVARRRRHAARVRRITNSIGNQVVQLGQADRQAGCRLQGQRYFGAAVGRDVGHGQRAGLAACITGRAIRDGCASHRLERGVRGNGLVEGMAGNRHRRVVGQREGVRQRLAGRGHGAARGQHFLHRNRRRLGGGGNRVGAEQGYQWLPIHDATHGERIGVDIAWPVAAGLQLDHEAPHRVLRQQAGADNAEGGHFILVRRATGTAEFRARAPARAACGQGVTGVRWIGIDGRCRCPCEVERRGRATVVGDWSGQRRQTQVWRARETAGVVGCRHAPVAVVGQDIDQVRRIHG